MSSDLFRPEAVQHQQQRLFGEVLIAWPIPMIWIAVGAATIVLALLTLAVFGEYTRKVYVEGYLAPDRGLVKLHSRESATIAERHVEEGQSVKRGDVLYILATDRGTDTGSTAGDVAISETRRRRDSLLQDQKKLMEIGKFQVEQVQTKIAALEEESQKVDREISLQRQRLDTFQQTTSRYRELVGSKFLSPNQLHVQAGLQLEQELELEGMERRKLVLVRDIAVAKKQLPEANLRLQADLANLSRQVSALEQEMAEAAARRGGKIVAPLDGTATAVQGEPGQVATPGLPLLNIIPHNSKLEAKLLVPASAIGFVEKGKEVRLRYAAYPYQRFGHHRGVVSKVAKSVVLPGELASPVTAKGSAYIVTVSLDQSAIDAYGQHRQLQSGMTLDADIMLDKRPIYEWVLEPLFSLKGKV